MPDASARPLRVLHWPTDVGGHPGGLARAERAIGLDSTVAVIRRGRYGYPVDLDLALGDRSRLERLGGRTRMFLAAFRDFDIIHLNFAQAFWPTVGSFGLDLPLLRQAGKRIFVTLQGCDARLPERCPVCRGGAGPCPLSESSARADAVAYAARHADRVFCLNPDLLDAAPNTVFMPYASVDPRRLRPAPPRVRTGPLRVVHAPTSRVTKGTDAVIGACSRLGALVELRLIENLPHDQALAAYADADVIVDQLRLGWYGGLAAEGMALARPVVCYIAPPLIARAGGDLASELPLIPADESTIEPVLHELALAPPDTLQAVGVRGRRFTERWHDPIALARWVASHYANPEFASPFEPEPCFNESPGVSQIDPHCKHRA